MFYMCVLQSTPSTCNDPIPSKPMSICVLISSRGNRRNIGLLREPSQLERNSETPHKLLLRWSAEWLKAMSVESNAQNRLPWTRLSYSTTGDGPLYFHHTHAKTHAVMNRMQASWPQTRYLGLLLMSLPGSPLSWNAVDWPAQWRILLIAAWIGLLSY